MSGNLSHQIEHHLFPDLPSNRYAEVAPQVQALFEKYGLTYCARPLVPQVYSAWHRVFRLSHAQRLAGDHEREEPALAAQAALRHGQGWPPRTPCRPGPDGVPGPQGRQGPPGGGAHS